LVIVGLFLSLAACQNPLEKKVSANIADVTDTALASLSASLSSDTAFASAALVPAFDPDVKSYAIYANALVCKARLSALLSDGAASLEYQVGSGSWTALVSGSGLANVDLSPGSTTRISLRVTSENGLRTSIYTIDAAVAGSGSGAPAVLLPPSPTTGLQFGYHVVMSADGSTLAVSSCVCGVVYVYEKRDAVWTLVASLSDLKGGATSSDSFGSGLAMSRDGRVIAAGAESQTVGGLMQAGRACVFRKNGSSWSSYSEDASLGVTPATTRENFGSSLALSDDGKVLVVGADHGFTSSDPGYAYVFRDDAGDGSWTSPVKLGPSNRSTKDEFGFAVAISPDGTAILVGAPLAPTPMAYFYRYVNSSWGLQAGETASDARFGSSVAIAAESGLLYAFVGAEGGQDQLATFYPGAVHSYEWDPNIGTQRVDQLSTLYASDAQDGARFGSSLSVSADNRYLAVASPWYMKNGDYVGAAYLFARSGTSWSQSQAYSNPYPASSVEGAFGNDAAVSVDGSTVAIGAYNRASWGMTAGGVVYVE